MYYYCNTLSIFSVSKILKSCHMEKKAKFYFQIVTTSGVPIYRQIIDQVKTQIASGSLGGDVFLPSVRQVASELEINPMTVSKAYSLLEKEDVLEFVRGQGMRMRMGRMVKTNLKEREENIKPLLKEVVMRSKQSLLEPKKIIDLLKLMWKE